MDFPPIPLIKSIVRIYALSLYHAGFLCRLATAPFTALVIWTAGFDLAVLAFFPDGTTHINGPYWFSLFLTFGGEFLAELFILNFLAIRVFRLLLLEDNDEESLFDNSALMLLPSFARQWIVIAIGNIVIFSLALLIVQLLGHWIGAAALLLGLPFAAAALIYYVWLSFVLPAAAVSVPYSFKESIIATKGAWISISLICLLSVAPWCLLSLFLPAMTGATEGPYNWVHWAMLPLISIIHCGRSIFFVVANAVCFQERTGWIPGAEKVHI